MIVYDIRDLVKIYPGQTAPANRDISQQIHQGEIFRLLGDNGAGKSTLVRQMVNLVRSTSGSITLLGQSIQHDPIYVPITGDEMMSRILVIGDPGVNELIRLILERQQDQARCTSDGRNGLSAAEQDRPDIVIIYLWTQGLNAFEFYEQAQASPTLRDIPILFYGAMPPERAYAMIQPLGVPGYLCEPFKIEELVAARDTLLRGETYFPSN